MLQSTGSRSRTQLSDCRQQEQLPTAAATCGQDHTLYHRHAPIQTVRVTVTGPDDDAIWGGACPPPFFIESLIPSTQNLYLVIVTFKGVIKVNRGQQGGGP